MRDGRIDRLVAICGIERGGRHAVEESDKPIDGCCPLCVMAENWVGRVKLHCGCLVVVGSRLSVVRRLQDYCGREGRRGVGMFRDVPIGRVAVRDERGKKGRRMLGVGMRKGSDRARREETR